MDLATSLEMRMAYIETGTINMRVNDAINSGNTKLVKPLWDSQKDLFRRMDATRTMPLKAM